MSGAWTADELSRIGASDELSIAARRPDGTLSPAVPIWVVQVGEDLYVRSWRGADGAWFRTVQRTHAAHIQAGGLEREVGLVGADPEVADPVDAAYQEKYARYPTYVGPMISNDARATTLKLVPGEENRA